MKNVLLVLVLLFVFFGPTFAESARDICTEEIRDAGIVDQEEIDIYMKECVSQVTAEMDSSQEVDEPEIENNSMETPATEES